MEQEIKTISTDDLKQKYFFHVLPEFKKETPLVISKNKHVGQKYFQEEFKTELKETSSSKPFTNEVLLFPGKIHQQLNQLFNPSGKSGLESSIVMKKAVTTSELNCLLANKGEMPKVQVEKLKKLLTPVSYSEKKQTRFQQIIRYLFKK